jgi:hypothetical protein
MFVVPPVSVTIMKKEKKKKKKKLLGKCEKEWEMLFPFLWPHSGSALDRRARGSESTSSTEGQSFHISPFLGGGMDGHEGRTPRTNWASKENRNPPHYSTIGFRNSCFWQLWTLFTSHPTSSLRSLLKGILKGFSLNLRWVENAILWPKLLGLYSQFYSTI